MWNKLLLADPTRRKFWRFLKSHMKGAGRITAVTNKDEQKLVFSQDEIEEEVLKHFRGIFSASTNRDTVSSDNHLVVEAMTDIDTMLDGKGISNPPNRNNE